MKTYSQFINEKKKYDPLAGTCSVSVGDDVFEFNIGKIINFAKKNYEVSEIPLDELYKLSAFKDVDVEGSKPSKNSSLLIKGKWKKGNDITDEEWEKFKKEQYDIVMKSNLRYPIVVVVNKKDKVKAILDGNHRVKKAKLLDKESVKAYKIPEEDIKNLSKEELKDLL
jgi:hypothetical protein